MADQLKAIARDLASLAANVSLDRESDATGRVLPTIPPEVLWRILPRLLERAAPEMGQKQGAFALALAATIQGKQQSPEIRCGKAV